ncbi:MAG: 4-(cytidine 5'-diphospho)-2-C-methyl-D-erythritol kinase [Oscillospiraceae bacterium]|nr:4-(cytidine 5'-diphospho)-2-C-methyl-D-erythritol kinase [Oscillospiraceae bacterium]
MDLIRENAYAKLNISLDVNEKRPDGYHNMTMVMQSISLCDELSVEKTDTGRIQIRSSLSFIPSDERNLAVRAALRYLEAVGAKGQGLRMELKKRIPVGAGMAGGSSDAAAVLRAMNRLYGGALSPEALETLSASVGSDVPFCVRGGTALATGRGEVLESLPPMPDCAFLVCKPDFSISTPELFRKLDQSSLRCHPDTVGILDALQRGELRQICRRMYNVFEDVDDRRLRTVAEIKGRLLDCGALGAIMTGTGSAVFGVFRPGSIPPDAAESLRRDYGFCEEAVCVPRLL